MIRRTDPPKAAPRLSRPRITAAFLLLALILAPATTVGAQTPDRVDSYLRSEMARNHIPGLSVAVVRDGKIVKLASYGLADVEQGVAVTPRTAFQLASATKPITATALMLLEQAGKIRLDDPVSRHLPDSPPSWSGITVRHLADHSSGIPDDPATAVRTTAEGVAALAKLPPAHAPGTRASYGIGGYIVLQHIIERIAGKPFDRFLRDSLFTPLGMEDTRFDSAGAGGPARATVYEWSAREGRQKNFSFPFPSHSYSAGGLYGTASDLARWAVALDKAQPLNAASQERMWRPSTLAGGAANPFAMGWVVGKYRGRRTVGHSGGPALADILRFVDEKLTIVVLANQQKMYPYLAQGVADLYVLAPPAAAAVDAAIADSDTKTTSVLRELLTGFSTGKVDPAPFAPQARGPLVGAIENFVMPWFLALGPPHTLTLIEEKSMEDGRRLRRYRARYGGKPVLWKFELDKEGKILAMEPTPE